MGWSGFKVTVDPTSEPVEVAEARDFCRIDVSDDDALLAALISAARQGVERTLNRALVTQTLAATWDGWPRGNVFVLPRGAPLGSVSSVAYVDGDGDSQTLSSDVYVVDTYAQPGRVALAWNQTWPTAREQANAITVTYVAGYGDGEDVPAAIRMGILSMVADVYEHREAFVEGQALQVNRTTRFLLGAYALPTVG